MGTSTNAIIAFGFDLGDELPDSLSGLMDECESDIDECLAADHSKTLPVFSESCDYKQYAAERVRVLGEIKIDLVRHCHIDYPMYFLAARGSDKTAGRGDPIGINLPDLDTEKFGTEVTEAMRAFCDRHGIEWQDPKWHIFSMWS